MLNTEMSLFRLSCCCWGLGNLGSLLFSNRWESFTTLIMTSHPSWSSGKSSIRTLLRCIYNLKTERFSYNINFQGMKVLVDAQKKLNIPLSNPENKLLGDQILLFDNTAGLNNTTFPQFQVGKGSLGFNIILWFFRPCWTVFGLIKESRMLLTGAVRLSELELWIYLL